MAAGKQVQQEQKLEDFQMQVLDLQRINTQLKMKLTQMVHSNGHPGEPRKTPYDHIEPRVDTNQTSRRLVPLWPSEAKSKMKKSSPVKQVVVDPAVSAVETRDEIVKLQMLVNVLRSKLQETDQKNQTLTEKLYKIENRDFADVQEYDFKFMLHECDMI